MSNGLKAAGHLQKIGYGQTAHINTLVFSPDGKYIVSGGEDNALWLWDTVSGKVIGKPWIGHEGNILALAFSPDGKYIVSGSWDHTLRLWDTSTGHSIGEPWHGHEKPSTVAWV